MEKIKFDSGIQSYRLNGGGVLQFNPADPNVYGRFLEAVEKVDSLQRELSQQANQLKEPSAADSIRLLQEADRQLKQILGWVFGQENDFHALLGGVNLLAKAGNGQRVIVNLLNALEPVLVAGAESCADACANEAVRRADARRKKQC